MCLLVSCLFSGIYIYTVYIYTVYIYIYTHCIYIYMCSVCVCLFLFYIVVWIFVITLPARRHAQVLTPRIASGTQRGCYQVQLGPWGPTLGVVYNLPIYISQYIYRFYIYIYIYRDYIYISVYVGYSWFSFTHPPIGLMGSHGFFFGQFHPMNRVRIVKHSETGVIFTNLPIKGVPLLMLGNKIHHPESYNVYHVWWKYNHQNMGGSFFAVLTL